MSARRIVQAVITLTLSATVVFGAAGMASAAFLANATATQSVSTLTLAPPTAPAGTCSSSFWGYVKQPVVTFGPSASESVIATRPTPPQGAPALTYRVTYQSYNAGKPATAGTEVLQSSNTPWTGPVYLGQSDRSWVVTVQTSYAGWTSPVVAAERFTC